MIENLRKYTVLIVVLFVLVVVGFILMDTSNMQNSRGGIPVLKIAKRTYTDGDLLKLGASGYQLTQALFRAGDFQVFGFLSLMAGDARSEEDVTENFFINRMMLRSAQEEFGIYPSEEEIDSKIRQFRLFTSNDGAFSQENYRQFVERGLGSIGLVEADIRELASDMLIQSKLADILGSGLSVDREMIAKQVAIDGQRINAKLVRIEMAPIKEKIAPSDEEVKAYWETLQDAFKTDEKRKFTYLVAKTILPADPEPIAPLAENADEAAKLAHGKQVADRDAKIAEDKRLARLQLGQKVDDLLYQLESQKDLDFKQLAESLGFEIKTTELATKSEMPAELQTALRSSGGRQSTAADALFNVTVSSDPVSRFIDLAIGENDWLIAHVDEVEASRMKTFGEAKDQARVQKIQDQATADLKAAASQAQEKIQAALGEGKSFDEAAKAAGIESEIETLTWVSQSTQLDPLKSPAGFFNAAKYTAPGSLTEPMIEADRAFIVFVEKREFVKDPNTESKISSEISREMESNQINSFMTWLSNKVEAANVQRLNRK